MVIKPSGSLAMTEINAEFGLGNNLAAYRGVQWWTPDGATGLFSINFISFAEFYNKMSTSPGGGGGGGGGDTGGGNDGGAGPGGDGGADGAGP